MLSEVTSYIPNLYTITGQYERRSVPGAGMMAEFTLASSHSTALSLPRLLQLNLQPQQIRLLNAYANNNNNGISNSSDIKEKIMK
jgi:hypothetical protein